ncbi:MAG: outer membrane beta-barrel protein [Comamonadaceae bacterium]|nr:outer membrane beta-barrel protein [Comamonadaceae bacterium]
MLDRTVEEANTNTLDRVGRPGTRRRRDPAGTDGHRLELPQHLRRGHAGPAPEPQPRSLYGNASFSRSDYQGVDRVDDYTGVGIGMWYRAAKYLYLDGSYNYRYLLSTDNTQNFEAAISSSCASPSP